MRFTFSEDQRLFARTVAELFETECTPERLRAGKAGTFARLTEMGVVGILAPESDGGLGMAFTDLVLLLEEAGRHAVPDPLVEHIAVAVPALAGTRWAGPAARGEMLVTVAAPYAPDADRAGVVLALRPEGVIAIEEPRLTQQRSLDPSRRLFSVQGDGPCIADEPSARARGAVGTAAVCLGLADRMIALAAGYATERQQFGKPIGEFQLVKGLLADALLQVRFAQPVVYRAADSIARDDERVARDVAMAKAFASTAVTQAARAALQVHGAIGYTEEHDLHLWLKRSWALANAWGTAAEHRAALTEAIVGR